MKAIGRIGKLVRRILHSKAPTSRFGRIVIVQSFHVLVSRSQKGSRIIDFLSFPVSSITIAYISQIGVSVCVTDQGHLDDPDVYHGAPVGLQLVARKWEEEKLCAIAKIVDTALKASAQRNLERDS